MNPCFRTLIGSVGAAFVLAFLLLTFSVPAHAGRSAAKIFVRVQADGGGPARAVANVFLSRLAPVPLLALLDGLETDHLDQEKALSESGLVQPDTAIRTDRSFEPDIVLTFRVTQADDSGAFSGSVTLTVAGQADRMIAVDGGQGFSLSGASRMHFLAAVAASLPERKKPIWSHSCFGALPRLDDLVSGACVQQFEGLCRGAATGPFDEIGCISELARTLDSRERTLDAHIDEYVDFGPAEVAVLKRIRDNDSTLKKDKEAQAVYMAMASKGTKFSQDCKAAFKAFRKGVEGSLASRITPPVQLEGFVPFEGDGVHVTAMGLTGFRFNRTDKSPQALLDVTFTATTPREDRDVFGAVHHFDKILRSFHLFVGLDGGGDNYDGLLMISTDLANGGVVKTAIVVERLVAARSFTVGKIERRSVRAK